MAKKILRSSIDSGRAVLPTKLAYLTNDKVDFDAVIDRDGVFSVELPAASVQKLVKARSELKANKADAKRLIAAHAAELQAEQAAHAEARQAMATAERRIKQLEKKLAAGAGVGGTAVKPATRKSSTRAIG